MYILHDLAAVEAVDNVADVEYISVVQVLGLGGGSVAHMGGGFSKGLGGTAQVGLLVAPLFRERACHLIIHAACT